MQVSVQQLFSNILGEKTEVALAGGPGDMTMNVVIPMQKDMYIADNNALQLLQDEDEKKALLRFDLAELPSKPLEVVIGWRQQETAAEKMETQYQHDAEPRN